MTPAEQGFLLLTSHLGNPDRNPLTAAQFRDLAFRVRQLNRPAGNPILCPEDLEKLGCSPVMAMRIVRLLESRLELEQYLSRGSRQGCMPVSRISPSYPAKVRKKLGLDAPGCLWARGNLSLLEKPAAALVGSRNLKEANGFFAREAGRQAALQGYVLVSGNARGADRTAQDSCLKHGGQVISVVADRLCSHPASDQILYLSEDGFDEEFSAQRALSRNRIIHCLGDLTFVAQSDLGQGGTWDGTTKNLRRGWSPVYCCQDGSPGIRELLRLGAGPVSLQDLDHFDDLLPRETEIQMEEFYE